MTFIEWFMEYQGADSVQRAVSRLSVDSRLSVGTIYNRLGGKSVGLLTAERLSSLSEGRVSVEDCREGPPLRAPKKRAPRRAGVAARAAA